MPKLLVSLRSIFFINGRFLAYAKPEITNYNIQISNKIKRQLFGILDFGHYNLFGICVLLFGIFFIAET